MGEKMSVKIKRSLFVMTNHYKKMKSTKVQTLLIGPFNSDYRASSFFLSPPFLSSYSSQFLLVTVRKVVLVTIRLIPVST